jgi:type I restriction enzyme S subunit
VIRSLDDARLSNRFLYYAMRPKLAEFRSVSTGVATKFLTLGILNETAINVPPFPSQRKIAMVLSAFDDLIDNNLRRIRILEDMAQALYREWFAEFRFPGHEQVPLVDSPLGEIPEGWEVKGAMENPHFSFIGKSIGPFTGTRRYFATADIEGIEIVREGIEYSYEQKPSRAQKQPQLHSVWFARMQETYKVLPVAGLNDDLAKSCMLSSGFAGFQASDEEAFPFVFLTINSKRFHSEKDRFSTGATQRSITNEGISRILTLSPPPKLVRQFGRITLAFIELLLVLQRQNQVLRRTRDFLLPRLISAELDVSDLDIAVPEAVA